MPVTILKVNASDHSKHALTFSSANHLSYSNTKHSDQTPPRYHFPFHFPEKIEKKKEKGARKFPNERRRRCSSRGTPIWARAHLRATITTSNRGRPSTLASAPSRTSSDGASFARSTESSPRRSCSPPSSPSSPSSIPQSTISSEGIPASSSSSSSFHSYVRQLMISPLSDFPLICWTFWWILSCLDPEKNLVNFLPIIPNLLSLVSLVLMDAFACFFQ